MKFETEQAGMQQELRVRALRRFALHKSDLKRYGKYCGIMYSGCPGEKPCDGLDACCMYHDACVQAMNNDYLSQKCSQNLLDCIARFKEHNTPSFKGNKCMVQEVADVITLVIEAALLAGRALHKP
ncbi:hypothetical protein M5K25_012490 [Dendrobium thyrsiflorum]|uniref:phospholipase A2 n=1 Tax=Dendrobium thyrsiflorum TaxID=117978 RepID=A0ABD0UXS0_DENTH